MLPDCRQNSSCPALDRNSLVGCVKYLSCLLQSGLSEYSSGVQLQWQRGRNTSEGVAEPSVAMLWSLYREVSDICSWQTCYYRRLTGNGPPDNRYLCCETRQHLLFHETQVTEKGSLRDKRLLQTSWDSSGFSLHPDNLTKFSGIDFFSNFCFVLFLPMASSWWILRMFIMGRTNWAKHD